LSDREKEKLFWLGCIEGMPIAAGGLFSIFTNSKLEAAIAAFLAIALTVFISWCLRHEVPLTRIGISQTKPDGHYSKGTAKT